MHDYVNFNGLSRFLQKIKDMFAQKKHSHECTDISDFPPSLPASDVYDWAKSESKPAYTWGEISGKNKE